MTQVKQTAVEWVFCEMSNVMAGSSNMSTLAILKRGLEMHQEQIQEAWMDAATELPTEEAAKLFAKRYYDKTYNVVEDEDEGDGTIPQDEDWFIDMLNEPDSEPEEYYERSSNPEYLIASTSYNANETYIFEGNADGEIVSFNEYGGLAERWGDSNWEDHEAAIKTISGHNHYHAVSRKGNYTLYKLTPPDEFTHFDGDESDRISY